LRTATRGVAGSGTKGRAGPGDHRDFGRADLDPGLARQGQALVARLAISSWLRCWGFAGSVGG